MTLPSPPRPRILRMLSLDMDRIQYMFTQPRTLTAQWNTEEINQRIKQGILCIKQRSDRNQTETRRPRVNNIYYNTVEPYYIIGHSMKIY